MALILVGEYGPYNLQVINTSLMKSIIIPYKAEHWKLNTGPARLENSRSGKAVINQHDLEKLFYCQVDAGPPVPTSIMDTSLCRCVYVNI